MYRRLLVLQLLCWLYIASVAMHGFTCLAKHRQPSYKDNTRANMMTHKMQKVLLLGDSLTERGFEPGGWAAHLAHLYGRRVRRAFNPTRASRRIAH